MIMVAELDHPSKKRVLEPIERISEVLFGLIMVLTFTCSISVAESGRAEIRTMLLGALGCNFAWGIIDAIMYIMGCLTERARGLRTLRSVQKAGSPEKAHRIIAEALPPTLSAVLAPPQFEDIRNRLAQLPEPAAHPRLSKRDWWGALGIFLWVFVSTFPVVIPFMFMQSALRAQRISNLIAVLLLFVTGYAFGRCIGYHPKGVGIVMVALGSALVALTILLGG
jgi:VIT1/CCC1 family predicted Fe2+/Mn2+ transporter